MAVTFSRSLVIVAGAALAGCGGGGGGDGGPANRALPGANGLDYGFAGQRLDEAETVEVSARAALLQDGADPFIGPTQITFGPGFFSNPPSGQSAEVEIFGEPVTITNGEGTLSNGQTVRINFDPTAAGTYAGAISLISYGSQQPGPPPFANDGEEHFVFGFETNPDTIEDFRGIRGTAVYAGSFSASGIVYDDVDNIVGDLGTEMTGTVTFDVGFDTGTVGGTLEGTYTTGTTPVDVSLILDENITDLNNTGFAGILECGTAPNCSSISTVEGDFFGPNAEELGGVVSLNVINDVGGADLNYTGAGSFIVTE
ncbi:transferrin-binding protein-like solute binding protein [Yoonia sp. SS1-5]|uniref:Transferrin-binding protein-like solute binding protein n=1 Tax=Yoonia rhodophyticola TaxID=3137370 RepID=A0AAN0MFR4_9RHOB